MTPTLAFKANQAPKITTSQAGFTLLEILMVLTIIGMASVLVVPNITNFESRTFDAQIRQANSLLNYARRMAVVSGQPAAVSFIIGVDEGADANAEKGQRDNRDDHNNGQRLAPVGQWYSEGSELRFRDSSDREVEIDDLIAITFYPEGGSTGGTLLISMSEESADDAISIEIDPFTGRVNTITSDN